jgi:hypothetical protein
MARFKHTDNSQGQFMVVNLKEQLLEDTFEWTIVTPQRQSPNRNVCP